METKITHILDDLSVEEASQLLDSEFTFLLDNGIQNRIINSTKIKSGLNNTNSSLHRFKNMFNIPFTRKKTLFSFASLLLLFVIGTGIYSYTQTPITYVSLDINPSVELAINKFDSVVSYNAYNIDGENILKDSECKHKKIDDAITRLVENAIEQKYIDNNKSFVISVATTIDDSSRQNTLNEDLKYRIYSTLKDNSINVDYEVDIVTSTSLMSSRDDANSMGISFGKLNLIEELISLYPSASVDEYKDKSVEYIQIKINEFKNNKEDDLSNDENLNIEVS
ncbi:MAG: anti-sigma-I factor RsgI family protein, partial [Romboutsia sp.]|uniref:anti-sigma-I factor RsgI family protein n=1 Tax=Romboutsia sp. TaxID=1965302 RepID=UPI003F4132E0